MFHISNFGKFKDKLRRFADVNGFVPQEGDKLEDMNYTKEFEKHVDWDAFKQNVAEATKEAEKQLDTWR